MRLGSVISPSASLNLGVPQGSVLGPLLFTIFINDLPNHLSSLTKLFADDTTLIVEDKEISTCISKLKNCLKQLSEWCKHNRLYINWSKTYLMFKTNKRLILLKQIDYDSISIEVVDEFKLLGVLIDNKIHFKAHIDRVSILVNKKLFSIKKLFYLPFEV